MTEDEYLAGEFTDAEIDKLADAGEYFLEEQGFYHKSSECELYNAAFEDERMIYNDESEQGEAELNDFPSRMNKPEGGCTRHWEVKRQPGGLWEIRLHGKLYVDKEGDPAIFPSELDAQRELYRIWKNGPHENS
jgi:hypothetical protein